MKTDLGGEGRKSGEHLPEYILLPNYSFFKMGKCFNRLSTGQVESMGIRVLELTLLTLPERKQITREIKTTNQALTQEEWDQSQPGPVSLLKLLQLVIL